VSKPIITRLFVGSIAAIAAGCVLGFAAVLAAYAGGALVMDGPDVAGVQLTSFAATMVALLLACLLALVVGAVAGVAAWVGALVNTAQLEDKAWFIILLALGVWNFGIVAMLAYVIAGPDGSLAVRQPASAMGTSR